MKKLTMLLFLGNVTAAALSITNEAKAFANPNAPAEAAFAYASTLTPYQDGSQANRQVKKSDEEITVQTKDGIKVKAQPGKSKVETATYESKIKGDERKFKSKTTDAKIKSEPGKAKYEAGDTKIKVKSKE
ncbi:MAG: hypothetical protein ACO1OF_19960 [Adhaeribacter sp.]